MENNFVPLNKVVEDFMNEERANPFYQRDYIKKLIDKYAPQPEDFKAFRDANEQAERKFEQWAEERLQSRDEPLTEDIPCEIVEPLKLDAPEDICPDCGKSYDEFEDNFLCTLCGFGTPYEEIDFDEQAEDNNPNDSRNL